MRRMFLLASLVGACLVLAGMPASAKPQAARGGSAVITVAFSCTEVDVTSTKDLSNVVLVFEDGTEVKYDGLDGLTGTFAGEGDHAGATITGSYVKSGNNKSGAGPGYGQFFASDADCGGDSGGGSGDCPPEVPDCSGGDPGDPGDTG